MRGGPALAREVEPVAVSELSRSGFARLPSSSAAVFASMRGRQCVGDAIWMSLQGLSYHLIMMSSVQSCPIAAQSLRGRQVVHVVSVFPAAGES